MRKVKIILGVVLVLWLFSFWPRTPEGTSVVSEAYPVSDQEITFLSDETYMHASGEQKSTQQIFNTAFSMIREAKSFVLVDMFLWNEFQGSVKEEHRLLASELTSALIAKKEGTPDITIVAITDPINTVYGGNGSELLDSLREAGITVVITDLSKLRDSNTIYSMWYRPFVSWLGNSTNGWLPNPLDAGGDDVTLRTYLRLLNFKANHRKVLVVDSGDGALVTLVSSANPHDGSSRHSNVALQIKDTGLGQAVVESERSVIEFSGGMGEVLRVTDTSQDSEGSSDIHVQLITENGIENTLVKHIDLLNEGDTLVMFMFYLSDRDVVRALKRAHDRGVVMRIVLDPNKDAFGREKNGVPNRPVAHELTKHVGDTGIVRWCDTHGEQCHSKMVLTQQGASSTLIIGSANLTRRNIGGYNLETNVVVSGPDESMVFNDARGLFNRVWGNGLGRTYTVGYSAYADDSWINTIMYRVMEFTGMSSF